MHYAQSTLHRRSRAWECIEKPTVPTMSSTVERKNINASAALAPFSGLDENWPWLIHSLKNSFISNSAELKYFICDEKAVTWERHWVIEIRSLRPLGGRGVMSPGPGLKTGPLSWRPLTHIKFLNVNLKYFYTNIDLSVATTTISPLTTTYWFSSASPLSLSLSLSHTNTQTLDTSVLSDCFLFLARVEKLQPITSDPRRLGGHILMPVNDDFSSYDQMILIPGRMSVLWESGTGSLLMKDGPVSTSVW